MSTTTGFMSGVMRVHWMGNDRTFDGCKIICEKIIRLTGLGKLVHLGGTVLDQCDEIVHCPDPMRCIR